MTTMGLEFLKLEEQKRSNVANEDIKRATNKETARHNLVTEGHEDRKIIEANRHNLVTEKETQRSNEAREKETQRANEVREKETQRSNEVREQETQRHNEFTEQAGIATQYGGKVKYDILNQLSGNTNNAQGFLAPIDALLYNTLSGAAPRGLSTLFSSF